MKKKKTVKILTTIGLCLIAGLSNVKAIDYPNYKSDYTVYDKNFTTNDRNSLNSQQKVSDWFREGLSKYATETREGQTYYMKGPADSEGLRDHYGEIKDSTGKVIGYRWYDLAWYVLYADSAGTWMTHNVYGDSGDIYGIKPGATGNFYLAVNLDTPINYLQEKYGVTIVEQNVKIYGYEKFKTVYGRTSQNFLEAYGLPTVTEGTIDWANKKGNLSFSQFTTNSGNIYGFNNKYNYEYQYGFTYEKVRSHGYYIPYMIYILFNECEYTVESNFPTEGNTENRQCCTYYETDENYKKIPGYTEGMTKEQTLEILYQDYPHCRVENKCLISDLPNYSTTTQPTLSHCCESLLEQYAGNSTAISQINKYCKTQSAGTVCDENDYTVNVDTPVSCTESTTGTISDITDWKCIFDSTNQSDNFEYSKFYLVESTAKNPYCSVYCREDINYEFPTNNISVEAGKHFTVNNDVSGIASWEPINFTNIRECRTTSSISNPVHMQMDVDDGYKALYNAIEAYKSYVSSVSSSNKYYYWSSSSKYERRKYYGCERERRYSWWKDDYEDKYDCSTRDRLLNNIYSAARSATCTAQCDYETVTITVPSSGWWSSTTTREYQIGYNYLVSGKINVEQFIKDWNYWNELVDYYWEQWKINDQFDAHDEKSYHTTSCPCGTDEDGNTKYCREDYTRWKTWAEYDGEDLKDSTDNKCGDDPTDWGELADKYEKKYKEAVEKRKQAEDYIWSCNDWEKFKETGTSSSLTSSKYAYSGSFSQFIKYDKFSPDLILNYNNSDWIYHYNDELDKILTNQQVSIDTTYYKFATADSAGYTYTKSLNEIFKNKYQTNNGWTEPLGQVEYIYPINEEARSEIEKSYSYHLPEDQYQYILKPQGLSVSEKPTDEDQEYINLGYTNLPVHFMTPEGSYPITLTYNKFSEKENLEHKFDDIVFGTDRNKSLVYSCNYYVDNEIIECADPPCTGANNPDSNPESCEEKCGSDDTCLTDCRECVANCDGDQSCIEDSCLTGNNDNPYDPTTDGLDALACILRCNGDQSCIERCATCSGQHCVTCSGSNCDNWRGLAVVYRPISLENPFPGIDGETREPGSNWKSSKVTIDGETKYLYISNNRNVTESEIYAAHVEPMYSFTLTPSVIMKIRNYNDTTSYGDFNMKCLKDSDGMWQECKSNFLRNQAGTGTGWQVQLGNNPAQSWVDWDTCGMQDNWDACKLEDEERS